ncbi:MAG: hypothetical protein R3C00_01005 [Hyphomonas sp.]
MSSGSLESHLFRRSFDDGWLDVLVGAGIVLIAASWIADAYAIGAVVPAVLYPFWKSGRQKLVEPRLGAVQFAKARVAETRRNLAGWLAFGAGVLAIELLVLVFGRRAGMTGLPALTNAAVAIPAILIGIGLLAGLLVGARRFVAYSVLAFAIGIAAAARGFDRPAWLILAIGAVILSAGIVMLARFLTTHPVAGLDE